MSENQKRGIIRGSNTRYSEGTEVEILNYCRTTDEYLVKPVEGNTQCWVKPEDLIVIRFLEASNESNI